jgi:hypothetical protein
LQRLPEDTKYDGKRQRMTAHLEELKAEAKALTESIPAEWTEKHGAFVKLKKADNNARRQYRRNVDEAYESVREANTVIAANGSLTAYSGEIAKIKETAATDPGAAVEAIKDLVTQIRTVPGTRSIADELSAARKSLRRSQPDSNQALKALDKAEQALATEIAWRQQASETLKPALAGYEAAIRETIGLRLQSRLPKKQALSVAACKSTPQDLTLDF